jgi:hypothetical protein
MRVETRGPEEKSKDKLGVALVAGMMALVALGYGLGAPSVAAHFPPTMERALLKMRAEIDRSTEGVLNSAFDIYHRVAGR